MDQPRTPSQEQVDQAMQHVVQVLNDFTATLPPSIRGVAGQTNQQAVSCIQAALKKDAAPSVPALKKVES